MCNVCRTWLRVWVGCCQELLTGVQLALGGGVQDGVDAAGHARFVVIWHFCNFTISHSVLVSGVNKVSEAHSYWSILAILSSYWSILPILSSYWSILSVSDGALVLSTNNIIRTNKICDNPIPHFVITPSHTPVLLITNDKKLSSNIPRLLL